MDHYLVCDPSLLFSKGHHLELSLSYDKKIAGHGHKVTHIISKYASSEVRQLLPKHEAIFSYNLYGKEFDVANPEEVLREDGRNLIDYISSLTDMGGNVNLLFHTTTADIVFMIREAIRSLGTRDMPLMHLCTPFSDSTSHSFRKTTNKLSEDIKKLLNDFNAFDRIRVYAENPALSYEISTCIGRRIGTMWIPSIRQQSFCYKSKVKRQMSIGFTGGAREERGFHLLPDIILSIKEFLEDSCLAESLYPSITIHFNRPINGLSPTCEDSLNKLACISGLILQEGVLTSQQYQSLISSFDVLLCPYDKSRYATRGSGVTQIAIAECVALCAPRCSSLYYSTPFVRDLFYDSIDELPTRIYTAIRSIDQFRSRLCAQSKIVADSGMLFRRN